MIQKVIMWTIFKTLFGNTISTSDWMFGEVLENDKLSCYCCFGGIFCVRDCEKFN